MGPSMQIFWILLLAGLFLIGAEIFVPGGILGIVGGVALVAAIVIAFGAFSAPVALMISAGIILLLGITLILWIKYFPKTIIGKSLTLSKDVRMYKATEAELNDLVGKEGVAQMTLRPAGIVKIANRRVDVVAEGGWIEQGANVRVIEVKGNRVVVREIQETEEEPSSSDSREQA